MGLKLMGSVLIQDDRGVRHRHSEEGHVRTEAQTREMWPPETTRDREPPLLPEAQLGADPADTLTLDFWPPELWENTFLLL